MIASPRRGVLAAILGALVMTGPAVAAFTPPVTVAEGGPELHAGMLATSPPGRAMLVWMAA